MISTFRAGPQVRRLSIAAATLSLAAAAAQPAAAQFHSWDRLCTPGQLRTCASVSIGFTWDPETDLSVITIGISNPQGLDGWPADAPRYGIHGVFIHDVQTTYNGSQWSYFHGPGESRTNGTYLEGAGDLDGVFIDASWFTESQDIAASIQQGGSYIWGCEGIPDGMPYIWRPYTCGGTIFVATQISGQWALTNQSFVTIWGSDEHGNGFSCGADCVTITTPEPTGLALLALGIVVIVFGRRRTLIRGKSAAC